MVATHEAGHFVCLALLPAPRRRRSGSRSRARCRGRRSSPQYKHDEHRDRPHPQRNARHALRALRRHRGRATAPGRRLHRPAVRPSGQRPVRATEIAEHIVEVCGMSDGGAAAASSATTRASATCSPARMAERLDQQVNTILSEQQTRAAEHPGRAPRRARSAARRGA